MKKYGTMMDLSNFNGWAKRWIVSSLIVLWGTSVAFGQGRSSAIVLKNGQALEGEVKEVTETGVKWVLPGLPQPQIYRYDQIDSIEFAATEEWHNAMTLFQQGNYPEAAKAFKAISLKRDSSTHYPAPGNFASLADRRLLDCYRRMRTASDIAYIAKRIEWDKLPSRERLVEGIIDCWAAVGNENWDEAEKAIETAKEKRLAISPASAELAYIAGLIALGKEQPNEAVLHFSRSYGPDAAADASMAADALERCIEIVRTDSERASELRAMVRLYVELYGNGSLWEEADDFLRKIALEVVGNPTAKE